MKNSQETKFERNDKNVYKQSIYQFFVRITISTKNKIIVYM